MNTRLILLVAMAIALQLYTLDNVHADNSHGCSNSTLDGSYSYYGTGVTEDGPYAVIGTLVFDGKGNATRRQSISRNGSFETNHLSFQYSVADNCTGKFLFKGDEFETLVIADGGKEIYILKESAQTVYLLAKKIHP